MKFCLLINATDRWLESVQHALSLAQTITDTGHVINTVFFYGQAIKVIKNPELTKQWQHWQQNTQTKLQLCSTLIGNQQLNSLASQIDGFESVSLGSWIQAVETADKTVELS